MVAVKRNPMASPKSRINRKYQFVKNHSMKRSPVNTTPRPMVLTARSGRNKK